MKITIDIDKNTASHIQSPHTFYGNCNEAQDVLRKVQKEIDKKVKKL